MRNAKLTILIANFASQVIKITYDEQTPKADKCCHSYDVIHE